MFNSLFLLECEKCQVILINNNSTSTTSSSHKPNEFNLKWFDRVYELNYSDIDSNDVFSYGIVVKPKIQIPFYNEDEFDIINQVYKSGEILNIQHVKEDPKYSKVFHKLLNYLI